MIELLALLLPVAAASGWLAASSHFQRKESGRSHSQSASHTPSDSVYVKGLNYFLNEKPERALEIFEKSGVPQANQTESRIALGNLFRRTGEVERAIDIHRGLLSEPSLSEEQHGQAVFELGMDFMRAGLFDRAENIFGALKSDRVYGQSAIQQLLQIYQHEKEWQKAIECARELKTSGKLRRGETVAQFYCELAEAAIRNHDLNLARNYIEIALDEPDGCLRVELVATKIEIREGNFKKALNILNSIESQDKRYLEPIADLMRECYRNIGNLSDQIDSLSKLDRSNSSPDLISAISRLIHERDGISAAQRFLMGKLEQNPSLKCMHDLVVLLSIEPPRDSKSIFRDLRDISSRLICDDPKYRCVQCGFQGLEFHWRCPSCHHWETLISMRGTALRR